MKRLGKEDGQKPKTLKRSEVARPSPKRPTDDDGSAVRPPASAQAGSEQGAAPPTLRRFRSNFRWDHVEREVYKLEARASGEFRGASRQVLAGKLGEQIGFHVRYFELEPDGFTSFEQHHHAHVVIAMQGKGWARVGAIRYRLKPFDVVYIGPDEPHQLGAATSSGFGFLCIVNARRDRPRPVSIT